VDWSAVADWANVSISFLTLVLGVFAVRMWRVQLRGGTKHQAAHEIAEAARMLRYAFYDARSPFFSAGEFPPSYRQRAMGTVATNDEQAAEYRHAFKNRLKELWVHLMKLANLRPRAGAAIGDPAANAVERLAKVARQLEFYMSERVEQYRVGPEIVAHWSDQAFVAKVNAGITADSEREDAYSREFEEAFTALLDTLKLHM